MKRNNLKENIIDVATLGQEGAFPCPKCGTMISPDDESEEVYQIVETKVKNDELTELTVRCSKCRSDIKLTNFFSQPDKEIPSQ